MANDNEDVDFTEAKVAAWRSDVRVRALAHLAATPAWPPRRWRIGAILLLLLLHLGVLLNLRHAMRATPASVQTMVEIRLIPDSPQEPPWPEPPPLNHPHAPAEMPRAKPALQVLPPLRTAIAPAERATELRLFNPDGSIQLPAEKPQPPSLEQRAVELRHRGHNMIHCRQTTFAQGYARDENLGDHIASKYLVWIGLADAQGIESRAARRQAAAAAACDG